MKSYNTENRNLNSCPLQQKELSFYEENYILEPEDYEIDNCYFTFEGDIEEDEDYCYRIAN